jgi:hypothetical protein
VGCVGLQGLGDIEGGEVDLLIPISVGVVVAAGVEDAVGDGVVADLFTVSVAKDQNGGGLVVCGRCGSARA